MKQKCPDQQSGPDAGPGIAIVILVSAFNLMGDAIRDVLDPKGGAVMSAILKVENLNVTLTYRKTSKNWLKT